MVLFLIKKIYADKNADEQINILNENDKQFQLTLESVKSIA